MSFGYSPASQIASNTRSNDAYAWTGHGSGTTGSTANGLNQLVTLGGATLTYDARGNMTNDGVGHGYAYTSENRLANASGTEAAHDPLGRLFWTSTGRFFDYDTAGRGGAMVTEMLNGQIARRFVFGPGVDEPLVWYEGPGTSDRRYLHADERGSIVAVTDSAGNVIGRNTYDEYGKPGSGNIGRFQYTGQKWIPELGLYDYKARMYNGGRFPQPDPIGYDDGMNIYAYVHGDPVNFVDPTGLDGSHAGDDCGTPDDPCEILVTGTRLPANLAALTHVGGNDAALANGGGGGSSGSGGGKSKKTTPKDLADLQKRMKEACAADQNNALCLSLKQQYMDALKEYNRQHPLPRATGDLRAPNIIWDGLKQGADVVACGIGVAGTALTDGLAAYLSGGAALWAATRDFGVIR